METTANEKTPNVLPQPAGELDSSNAVRPDKGAVNLLLVLSCLAFGAASFLFGYDDKVISPVAATPAFVSCLLQASSLCRV